MTARFKDLALDANDHQAPAVTVSPATSEPIRFAAPPRDA